MFYADIMKLYISGLGQVRKLKFRTNIYLSSKDTMFQCRHAGVILCKYRRGFEHGSNMLANINIKQLCFLAYINTIIYKYMYKFNGPG